MSIVHQLLLSSFSLFFLSSFSFASSNTNVTIKTPLTPREYGLHLFNLSFGTPPQPLRFVLDTSTGFSWFPCTRKYNCTRCNSSTDPHIPTFIPKLSSSYKTLPCKSPQCQMVVSNKTCNNKNTVKECAYIADDGTEKTSGHLVSETLTVRGLSVDNFTIGCSLSSYFKQGAGYMGFTRGPLSMPSQLRLKSFSYCLVSYENLASSSDLVLSTTGEKSSRDDDVRGKIRYTPFLNNVNSHAYYVCIQNISVGGVKVKVQAKHLMKINATGYGGTLVATSSTLTWMVEDVYSIVFKEFQKQVKLKLKKSIHLDESPIDFETCYKVSKEKKIGTLPQLTFYFQEGATMVVPMAKYFKNESVLCMCVNNAKGFDQQRAAIVLGNYQMQDHYMNFDLKHNRLGILSTICGH